jgi:hypothetical protein
VAQAFAAVLRGRDGASKPHQNGQSSRADAGSVGPSSLDRKNRTVRGCVRSCDFVRSSHCATRCQHGRAKVASATNLTPLCSY